MSRLLTTRIWARRSWRFKYAASLKGPHGTGHTLAISDARCFEYEPVMLMVTDDFSGVYGTTSPAPGLSSVLRGLLFYGSRLNPVAHTEHPAARESPPEFAPCADRADED
jgi:hypothetical protein